jgi:hypothetical protein
LVTPETCPAHIEQEICLTKRPKTSEKSALQWLFATFVLNHSGEKRQSARPRSGQQEGLLITHQEEVVLIADRASQLGATHIVFPGGLKETVDHVLGEAASDATGVHGVRKSNMENALAIRDGDG